MADGSKSFMELSGSNVLRYEMTDGTSLIVRPSGTEPLVRVMIEGKDQDQLQAEAESLARYIEEVLQ